MPKAIPKVHFTIEYVNAAGDRVETLAATNDRSLLHKLLDEYLDQNTAWDDEELRFQVSSACQCDA